MPLEIKSNGGTSLILSAVRLTHFSHSSHELFHKAWNMFQLFIGKMKKKKKYAKHRTADSENETVGHFWYSLTVP